jgi:hypothetical protein
MRNRKREDYAVAWCRELYNVYGDKVIVLPNNNSIAYNNGNWIIYLTADYFNIIIRDVIKAVCAKPNQASAAIVNDILHITICNQFYEEYLKMFSYRQIDLYKYINSQHIYISKINIDYII